MESLPVRGVWIEIDPTAEQAVSHVMSLPVMGVWIEILSLKLIFISTIVTPLDGSMN